MSPITRAQWEMKKIMKTGGRHEEPTWNRTLLLSAFAIRLALVMCRRRADPDPTRSRRRSQESRCPRLPGQERRGQGPSTTTRQMAPRAARPSQPPRFADVGRDPHQGGLGAFPRRKDRRAAPFTWPRFAIHV